MKPERLGNLVERLEAWIGSPGFKIDDLLTGETEILCKFSLRQTNRLPDGLEVLGKSQVPKSRSGCQLIAAGAQLFFASLSKFWHGASSDENVLST